MSKNLICLLVLACGLWQCTEVSDLSNDLGREYYPVKVGNYWIYDVSETTFNNQFLTDPADSITYQVRERVDTVFRNQAGELTYQLIRSRRPHAGQPWDQDSIITITKSLSDLTYTRDNLKTVKLVFPPAENKKWNGNAFNFREPEEYSFAQVGQPFTLEDTTFQNTVKVIQNQRHDVVKLIDCHEVYALGLGMIYKRVLEYFYEPCTTEKCENVRPGFVIQARRIRHQIIDFGQMKK